MLRIYRRDSSNSQLGADAVADDTPKDTPARGFGSVLVFARSPAGEFTVTILGRLKANGSNATIAELECGAGEQLNQAIAVAGYELVDVVLENGSTAQRPEVSIDLVRIGEAT